MSIAQRTAWLQKHPTPLAGAGEFHWYPAADGDRALRSAFVERMRGKAAPFALWHVSRGVVAWAQAFAATAPSDGRHYVGLVVTIAEGDAPIAALLESLALPAAAPWTPDVVAPRPDNCGSTTGLDSRDDDAAAARSLLSGGTARAFAPDSPALPAWLAQFERALDEHLPAVGGVRTGAIEALEPGDVPDAPDALAGPDPIARLCAAAARLDAAWRLACELAGSREALDGVGAAAAQLEATGDGRGVLTAAERERIGDARRVPEILLAWGRGRLDDAGGAATLPARLAELVAWRALAMLASGRDANAALAEARWQALLPAARRSALFAALVQRAPSLRGLALLPARDAISVAHRMEVTHA